MVVGSRIQDNHLQEHLTFFPKSIYGSTIRYLKYLLRYDERLATRARCANGQILQQKSEWTKDIVIVEFNSLE